MTTTKILRRKSLEIRKKVIKMIYDAKTGHAGGTLSSLDILVVLFYHIMRLDPSNPQWPERDRFILSKGHSVEGYYSILADMGFFPETELATFSQFGSRLIGHPTNKVPGIEVNTGSLGHGLSIGVGTALAGKLDNKDYKTFVLMGDGELAEGSVWEGAMAAAHYQLDNLIAIIDRNYLQISGSTEEVMRLENLAGKWREFGWEIQEIDGHNYEELIETFFKVPFVKNKPNLIIANTIKGKDISFMENLAKWHHGIPTKEQMEAAIAELDQKLQGLSA